MYAPDGTKLFVYNPQAKGARQHTMRPEGNPGACSLPLNADDILQA
jgi:hypothetical protein